MKKLTTWWTFRLFVRAATDHDALQSLLQEASVQQFLSAKNFFNAKLI